MQRKYTRMIAINGTRLVSKDESRSEISQSHRLTKLQYTIVVTVTIYLFFLTRVISGFQAFQDIFFTIISSHIQQKVLKYILCFSYQFLVFLILRI